MTEKRFTIGMLKNFVNDNKTNYCYSLELPSEAEHLCNLLNELNDENEQLKHDATVLIQANQDYRKDNEQLKQFPIKLDNRISKLEESLKALKEMETDDLNPQAVEDVAIVIGMSLNALKEFKKELKGDDVE